MFEPTLHPLVHLLLGAVCAGIGWALLAMVPGLCRKDDWQPQRTVAPMRWLAVAFLVFGVLFTAAMFLHMVAAVIGLLDAAMQLLYAWGVL